MTGWQPNIDKGRQGLLIQEGRGTHVRAIKGRIDHGTQVKINKKGGKTGSKSAENTKADTKTDPDRQQLLLGTLGSALANICKGQKHCASCSCQEPALAQWQLGPDPSYNLYSPQHSRLKNKGEMEILISEHIRGKKNIVFLLPSLDLFNPP